jgi:hypothetical protein
MFRTIVAQVRRAYPLGMPDTVTVLVDGENVRRSRWPNLSPDELVERCSAWAEANRVRVVVVFDGRAPPWDETPTCVVVGTGSESADDWLAREAPGYKPYWLVTSDRELRERAGTAADDVIGGGRFARILSS